MAIFYNRLQNYYFFFIRTNERRFLRKERIIFRNQTPDNHGSSAIMLITVRKRFGYEKEFLFQGVKHVFLHQKHMFLHQKLMYLGRKHKNPLQAGRIIYTST